MSVVFRDSMISDDSASYTCSLFYPVRHSSNLDNVVPKMGSSWNYLAFTCWVTEKTQRIFHTDPFSELLFRGWLGV